MNYADAVGGLKCRQGSLAGTKEGHGLLAHALMAGGLLSAGLYTQT
mgnify:CR=1